MIRDYLEIPLSWVIALTAIVAVALMLAVRHYDAARQAITNAHCPAPDRAVWIPAAGRHGAWGCGESITAGVGSR